MKAKDMKARDIMTPQPRCCSADDTLEHAARIMLEEDVGEVPVVDAQRHPAGVITDRDIVVRCVANGERTDQSRVGQCMTVPAKTLREDASLEDVAKTQKAKIQPGEWQVTMEMIDQKVTGGPPGMPAMPKSPPVTTKTCITPEQVNRPEGMFSGGMDSLKKNCTYDSFSMADGKIDAKMHCQMPDGMKIEATNSGTFSATELSSDSTSSVTGLPVGSAVPEVI